VCGSGSVDRSRLLWVCCGPDLAWSAAYGERVSGITRRGQRSMEPASSVDISAGHRRLSRSGGGIRSSCVPLSPAVARTHDGRDSRRPRQFLWASGGPVAGAEGLLDLLAGDLVAAGYGVRIDGEQDTHAMPGAGSDLGGRGAGGQPQRQRSMTQIVGAAHPARCLFRPAAWLRRGPAARSGRRGFR
jgi:hypothetical protein